MVVWKSLFCIGRQGDRRGNVLIEFAAIAGLLALILVATIDLTLAAHASASLKSAARVGAEYALVHPSDQTGIANAVTRALSIDPSAVTVTSAKTCECDNGSSITCGIVCTTGEGNRIFVTVRASENYPVLLPYPGLPTTLALSGMAMLRVQ